MKKKLTKKDKERQDYINSLYSVEEQKQIKKGVLDLNNLSDSIKGNLKEVNHKFKTFISDYFIIDEKYRLLKKHFKLSDEAASEIIDKIRMPFYVSNFDDNISNIDFDPLSTPVKPRNFTGSKTKTKKKTK